MYMETNCTIQVLLISSCCFSGHTMTSGSPPVWLHFLAAEVNTLYINISTILCSKISLLLVSTITSYRDGRSSLNWTTFSFSDT